MKKQNKKYISTMMALAMAGMSLTSCDDLFEPAAELNLGIEYMYDHPSYAEGVLGNAYTRIPCSSFPFDEVATDDAVSNVSDNSYRKMAAGSWTSSSNPEDSWTNCRAAIGYINIFLSKAPDVKWVSDDQITSDMYRDREMGEAYGMRAMYMYYLLRAHGGYTADGELLGVPIVTTPEDANTNYNIPRNTFQECMAAIYADCDSALELLPTKYADANSNDDVPAKYLSQGATATKYTRVFGSKFNGRMDGAIVEAFRAKAALLAASPAYNGASGGSYETAANYAAIVLDRIGGVSGMDSTGWTWYCNSSEIEALADGANPDEILWRGEKSSNSTWETNNFPPSLYGSGQINPTQNFVDAFSDINGYPITHAKSIYNANDPYTNRDPRLAAYVVYNGSTAGVNSTTITTAVDGDTKDALNKVTGSSTRTGYYMRKLLRQDVNLDPTSSTTQYHYTPRIRYTEIFLDYAEAANEAYGPTGKGTHSYSAYDVIVALHNRAGVGNDYLESIKDDKEAMRELIRNERRIELSFEGHRFWDLRRWNAELNETATGMSINSTTGTYTGISVETRNYKDYMYYGPIPYTEVLKYDQLKQNKGW